MPLSKDLVAASSIPLILSILQRGDSYGYAIIQQVRELSDGEMQWADGMLYPILHRLEAERHPEQQHSDRADQQRPADATGGLGAHHPHPGQAEDRQEQGRGGPEQQKQGIAGIGPETAKPIEWRPPGRGGEGRVDTVVSEKCHAERDAQPNQHRAKRSDREQA
jgi:hypothetical protein